MEKSEKTKTPPVKAKKENIKKAVIPVEERLKNVELYIKKQKKNKAEAKKQCDKLENELFIFPLIDKIKMLIKIIKRIL